MIPERIWLQWDDSKNEFDCRCITWCDSPIPEADNIEYVRAPQWVSVEDGLPKVGSDVWVDTGKKVPVLGKFDVVDWDDWDGNSTSGECFTDDTWEEIIPNDEVIGWCYANIPAPPEVK